MPVIEMKQETFHKLQLSDSMLYQHKAIGSNVPVVLFYNGMQVKPIYEKYTNEGIVCDKCGGKTPYTVQDFPVSCSYCGGVF